MLTQKATGPMNTKSDNATDNEQAQTLPTSSDTTYETKRLENEFLAIISHELRSPLAAIKGYAATLRRHGHKLGRAERDEFLQAIDEASDRLEVLISRLMELSHLEADTLRPNLVPVDVVHVVREAIAAAEHRWESKANPYTFVAPEQDTMSPVLADLRMLRETLDIVLENAVKYTPGGGVIKVTLQADDTMLTIGVHDSGIGIPPEHVNRIFERFHRVDTRLTREVEGAGLGLAICKRVMALQGGDIWVESTPDEGSNFYMTLPLVKPQTHETA